MPRSAPTSLGFAWLINRLIYGCYRYGCKEFEMFNYTVLMYHDRMIPDTWYLTPVLDMLSLDTWYLTLDIWHWYLTCYTWHLIYDTWQLTCYHLTCFHMVLVYLTWCCDSWPDYYYIWHLLYFAYSWLSLYADLAWLLYCYQTFGIPELLCSWTLVFLNPYNRETPNTTLLLIPVIR